MLSRVADSLYWMSRYLERAEHTTRLLDVNLNLMLDESPISAERRWQRVLQALGKPKNVEWDWRAICTDTGIDVRYREQGFNFVVHYCCAGELSARERAGFRRNNGID